MGKKLAISECLKFELCNWKIYEIIILMIVLSVVLLNFIIFLSDLKIWMKIIISNIFFLQIHI